MTKFSSDAQILEVCEYARYAPGYLNRQLITLLMSKCLGVPDSAFRELQVPISENICRPKQVPKYTSASKDVLITNAYTSEV